MVQLLVVERPIETILLVEVFGFGGLLFKELGSKPFLKFSSAVTFCFGLSECEARLRSFLGALENSSFWQFWISGQDVY